MAGALIGALRVSLSAETSAFEAGMKRSQRQAAKTAGYIRTSFGGVGASIKSSLAGLAAGLTIGGLVAAGKAALNYAGHLGELADTLGLTTKDLQEFGFAAGQVGISQEDLEAGIQKLTISMGKAQLGSQAQVKAFNAIGISIADIKNKGAGEVFRMIADKLQNVSDRSKRAAVEVALFGKAGAKLDNLLSGAQGSLNGLSAAAEKLGIVLSDDEIRKADETADKLEALKTVMKANIAREVVANAGAILELADALATLVKWTGQAIQGWKSMIAEFSKKEGRIGALIGNAYHGGPNPWSGDDAKAATWNKIMAGNSELINRGKPRGGGGDIGNFLAGSGPKPKEDHTAEKLARQAYELQKQQLDAEADILQAKQDLSTDYIEQTTLQIDILDNQRAQKKADLDYQVKQYQLSKGMDGITQAQADQQLAQYDIADSLKRRKVINDEIEHREQDVQELTQSDFDRRRETLEKLSDLAETASERRQIELELLKLAYEQKRQALQDIIDHSKDIKDKEDARRALLTLNKNFALDKQNTIQNTRGPMEDYLSTITSADKLNEALQNLEVQGFEGLIDAALALSGGFKNAKEALLDTLKSFLLGLARIELQAALGNSLKGSGFLSSIIGGARAGGGPVRGGIPYLVGERGPELFVPGMAGLVLPNLSLSSRVSVNDNGSSTRGNSGTYVQMTINTPNADSFRKSDGQIVRQMRRRLNV